MNIIFITLHFWVCHTSHLHSPHHCGSLLKFLLCIVEWMHIYPKTCWLSKIAGKYLVATSSSILSYCQFLSPLLWNNFALLLQLCFYAHNKLIFLLILLSLGVGWMSCRSQQRTIVNCMSINEDNVMVSAGMCLKLKCSSPWAICICKW